jgi:hypothetical protein
MIIDICQQIEYLHNNFKTLMKEWLGVMIDILCNEHIVMKDYKLLYN